MLDGKKGAVKLPPDTQGYYVVAVDGIYTQCKFGELSKPKTPEEELMGELHYHFDKYTFTDQAINELPLKFNITKKPQ